MRLLAGLLLAAVTITACTATATSPVANEEFCTSQTIHLAATTDVTDDGLRQVYGSCMAMVEQVTSK